MKTHGSPGHWEATTLVKYTGWLRKFSNDHRVLYTGFYMVGVAPIQGNPVVKAVFPMPDGNATVVLRPKVGDQRE